LFARTTLSEQRSHCYIKNTHDQIQSFYQDTGSYPITLYDDTFGGAYRVLNIENMCDAASSPFWYDSPARTLLLYQKQIDTYILGGYYNHNILSFFGLTRVCHYDQATKDVACGFNNWAPFSPP